MSRSLKDAFLRIADRSLDAAEAAAARGVQEKAGFLAYHSFESCGGAFCNSRGIHFHPAKHAIKIQNFVRGVKKEKFALETAQLAAEVAALRNAFLYPRSIHGSIHMPEDTITVAQAGRLIGRLRRLAGRLRAAI